LAILHSSFQRFAAAGHGDLSGAHDLHNAEFPQQFDYGRNLVFVSGYFDHQTAPRDVHDLCPEYIDYLHDRGPLRRGGVYLHQGQLASYGTRVFQRRYLQYVDELVELLFYLLQDSFVPVDDDGHSRQTRILRYPHGQALDVEPASSEQARYAGENPRLVFDKY
jgi:hypothetical protein